MRLASSRRGFRLINVAAAALALHFGCVDGQAVLSVAVDTVAPGQSVAVTLSNNTNRSVKYNLCVSALELHAAGEWIKVEAAATSPGSTCKLDLLDLAPGGVASFDRAISLDRSDGRYRLSTTIEKDGKSEVIISNEFEIKQAP